MSLLTAVVLTAAINVDIDLTSLIRRASQNEPTATCGISTVGYRFRGTPGQRFRYAGDTWTVPATGSIELIADRDKNTYTIADRSLPLDVWPRDQFGFREVPLPSAAQLNKGDTK